MADVVTKFNRDDKKAWFKVEWSDGYKARFPYVFLFDNCRCPDCFHPASYQRSVLMANIDPDIRPTGHEVVQNGEVIQVTWPNGHVSPYPAKWLKVSQLLPGNVISLNILSVNNHYSHRTVHYKPVSQC